MSAAKTNSSKLLKKFFNNSQSTLVIGIIILSVVIYIGNPVFLSFSNIKNIGVAVAYSGIMVTGLTVAMLGGDLDLSQMSCGAFSGMVIALLIENMGISPILALLVAVLLGMLIGFVNGVLCTKMHILPMIATLGTNYILRSFAYMTTNSASIYFTHPFLKNLSVYNIFGIPLSIYIMFICFAIFYYIIKYTSFGRKVIAVGGNPTAAHLSGINVDRVKIEAMMLSSIMAVLGGLVCASQVGAIQPVQGNGQELDNMISVILGGVSLAGGDGRIVGTLLGVIFMGILKNGLTLLSVQSYYQTLARGAVLILAVYLDSVRRKASTR